MLPDCDVVCCYHVNTGTIFKMADNGVSFRQHADVEFLVKEEKSATEIHLGLQRAYADAAWSPAMLGDG